MTQQGTADPWGIQREWIDADELRRVVPAETVALMREAIGTPPNDLEERAPVVTRPGRSTGTAGEVACEDGSTRRLDDVVRLDDLVGRNGLVELGGLGQLGRLGVLLRHVVLHR